MDNYTIHITVNTRTDHPVAADWTWQAAEERVLRLLDAGVDAYHTSVDLPPLSTLVDGYFRHLKYRDPNDLEAFLFLVSEVGEMADALAERHASGWVRNNPNHKHKNPEREGGDVLMMLVKTAQKLGADPLVEMFARWREKKYPIGE